jgi:hypothetical protein
VFGVDPMKGVDTVGTFGVVDPPAGRVVFGTAVMHFELRSFLTVVGTAGVGLVGLVGVEMKAVVLTTDM